MNLIIKRCKMAERVKEALERNDMNVQKTAKQLGVDETIVRSVKKSMKTE